MSTNTLQSPHDSTAINLDNENPLYTNAKFDYELWDDLYSSKIAGRQKYLPKHPLESDDSYAIRLRQRSYYVNQAKPIIDVYIASIFRKKVIRKLPEPLPQFKEDVNLQNIFAEDFFREVARETCKTGVSFVLIDSPSITTTTLAESLYHEVRPYFVHIKAEDLIDWGFKILQNGRRVLSYIVIKEEHQMNSTPFADHETVKLYRVWTRDKWELWADNSYEGIMESTASLVSSGENPLGEIPLVPFFFEKDKELTGRGALADVADLLLKNYRNGVELDSALFFGSVPMYALLGFTEDEMENFQIKHGNVIWSQNLMGTAKVEVVEAEGKSVDSLLKSIHENERSIKEISLRLYKPDKAIRESYLSRKIDHDQLYSYLTIFALSLEDSETKCWQYALKWMNRDIDGIEITYNTDFSGSDYGSDILNTISLLKEKQIIPEKSVYEVLKRAEIIDAEMSFEDYSNSIGKLKEPIAMVNDVE